MSDAHPLDAKRLEAFTPEPAPKKKQTVGRRIGKGFVEKPPGGPGWGGEAKGTGRDLSDPAERFDRSLVTPEEMRARAANKAELAEEALGHMVTIMRESAYEANRLNAAAKVRAEIVGNPMQRSLTAQTTPEHLVDQAQIDALTPEQKDALRDIANALLERREGPALTGD